MNLNELSEQREAGGGAYLCHVIIKLLQCFLAVNKSVAGAFPQFHQESFVCCQELTTCV